MSSRSSRIRRNVVQQQQDKYCHGVAGLVEISSWSTGIHRNVVPEQQDRSKCRKTSKYRTDDGDGQEWKVRSMIGRNVFLEHQDRSKCRPGAAGLVEMSSQSNRISRNVVPEQQDWSKCRPVAAGYIEMSSQSSRTSRNVVPEQQDSSKCSRTARNVVPRSSRIGRNVVLEGVSGSKRRKPSQKFRGPDRTFIYRYVYVYLYTDKTIPLDPQIIGRKSSQLFVNNCQKNASGIYPKFTVSEIFLDSIKCF